MKLPNVTDDERAFLQDMRALETDAEGREVYVGLSRDESEWLHAYSANMLLPLEDQAPELERMGDRYLDLHGRHERQRLAVVMGEIEARGQPHRH